MPDTKYERDTQRMDCLGLDLNRPVDSVRPGHFPLFKNIRSFRGGRVEPRFGLVNNGANPDAATPCHSLRRLNYPTTGDYTYIRGDGTKLYFGKPPTFANVKYNGVNVTFSGNPLALIPYLPEESPESWMLVADSNPGPSAAAPLYFNTMKKVKADGTCHQIGLPTPVTPPSAALGVPAIKYTDPDFDFEYANDGALQAAWINGGVAALPTRIARVNTTISSIQYDVGTTGWASVNPASMAQIGQGAIIVVGAGTDKIVVQETHEGTFATTIKSVLYESGSTGACSIVLSESPDFSGEVNAMMGNTPRNETVRILSSSKGSDGSLSIRCVTGGTFQVNDAVDIKPSFRAYFVNNHVATETLKSFGAQFAITGAGVATLTRTAGYDLASIITGIAARPDDYLHSSMLADLPANITEIKLLADFDLSTNDFTKNFFSLSVRPSDLTQSVTDAQSLINTRQATVIPRSIIDNVRTPLDTLAGVDPSIRSTIDVFPLDASSTGDVVSLQAGTGKNQWTEILSKQSDFVRVGTDFSRGWANIKAIRIQVTATAALQFAFDDINLSGGYGPDQSPTGIPYIYRYRPRVVATGTVGNPSPPSRGGVASYRQQILVTVPSYGLATEPDAFDIERLGGDIPTWHYVGTVYTSGSLVFSDGVLDDIAGGNPDLGTNNFQPWPIVDIPRSGTATTVSGSLILSSTPTFGNEWAQGTTILIGGQPYTIYRFISTTIMEIFENAGALSNVPWVVPKPLIVSQPLPCMWGPVDNTNFGCGDLLNPGRLYWFTINGEGTGEDFHYDVTPPSEPLVNGVMYNNRAFVWSTERFFQILPIPGLPNQWESHALPNGKGLFSRWAVTRDPGPLMYYLTRDGIYETNGGNSLSITDEWLRPLFPTEDTLGSSVSYIGAPKLDSSVATRLRLDYADGHLYFDYADTSSNRSTLMWDGVGWFFDIYTPDVVFHYADEFQSSLGLFVGGSNGKIYKVSGNNDDGVAIPCNIRMPSRDQGDPRLLKRYGDIMLDADASSYTLIAIPGVNNHSITFPPINVITSGRQQNFIDLAVAAWQVARNVSLDISFTINNGGRPFLYIWEPRWTFESAPIAAFSWEISPSTFGLANFKSFGIGRIGHVSTADLTMQITLDGGIVQPLITIPNSGGLYSEKVFRFPVYKSKFYHVRVSSTAAFRLDGRDSFVEVKEWASTGAYRRFRTFSDFSVIEG